MAEDIFRLARARPIPPRPDVAGLADLARLVLERAGEGPVDLVAQSMGGVVVMLVAVDGRSACAGSSSPPTSAGIDITPFGPEDWRPAYTQEYPGAASWILTERPNLAALLPTVAAPTLLKA